ncbi:MAG: Gfo/Idh/MocA family protein [Thermoguttaceae bacterium]
MAHITRRRFLEDSLIASFSLSAAAAVFETGSSNAFAQSPAAGANDILGVLSIGAGGRSTEHLNFFSKDPRTKVLYVCDPDLKRAEQKCQQIEEKTGHRPKAIADFRKALEDKSVDIVTSASPNHWHVLAAIWSLQAGKHCYIEKPLSYNIHEGKAIVAAVKKYGRILQTGTQCRSAKNVKEVAKFIHDGGIGDVKFARGLCYKRRKSIGPLGEYPIPEGVDYDLWSGPAELKPLTRRNFHYDWHWQRHYGNGDLGNQGPHQTDIARLFLGVERFPKSVISYGGRLGYDVETKNPDFVDAGDVANTEVSIYDYGDKCIVFETRGLETPNTNIPVGENLGTQVGVIAYGTKGYAIQGSAKGQSYGYSVAYDLEGNMMKEFNGGDDHYSNFIEAVQKNDPAILTADARCGALSAAVSHLGNISYYAGEKNKVSVADIQSALEKVKSLDDNGETLARTVHHLEANGVDLKRTPMSLGPFLSIDVENEVFIGNDEANAMLTRNYRKGYVVPDPKDV